ncbi:hypothetical protein KDRO_A07640 [Kluyveromyces lactis]|nr:hypothetical protein KDRO_A07640 [Kluyveromyces lactis]
MDVTANYPTLFCSEQYILPINSNTTLEQANSCGQLWGEKHKYKGWPSKFFAVNPPFYQNGNFVAEPGFEYVGCGSDYILEQTENTTLQQSWQCGVFAGANVKTNSSPAKLRASVFLYLLMLVAYIM